MVIAGEARIAGNDRRVGHAGRKQAATQGNGKQCFLSVHFITPVWLVDFESGGWWTSVSSFGGYAQIVPRDAFSYNSMPCLALPCLALPIRKDFRQVCSGFLTH
jgi:hypothetical protein